MEVYCHTVGSVSHSRVGTCSFESDEVPAAFELRHDLIARTLGTHGVVYEVHRAIRDPIGPVLRAVINRDVRAEALHESNVVSTARCYDLTKRRARLSLREWRHNLHGVPARTQWNKLWAVLPQDDRLTHSAAGGRGPWPRRKLVRAGCRHARCLRCHPGPRP